MGMFDDLTCKYLLPVKGANELSFQTKDTPAQFLDKYEIREDDTLWHEYYDTEDRSDKNAEGIPSFVGCMARVNERWEKVDFTGEIRFYTSLGEDHSGWIEFSSYFVNGQIKQLHLIEHIEPKKADQPATTQEEK